MASFRVTEQLARASARRPWVVVGFWVMLFLAGGFLASGIGDVLTTEFALTNEPESVKADQLWADRLRGPETRLDGFPGGTCALDHTGRRLRHEPERGDQQHEAEGRSDQSRQHPE